jgi:hypothetical protein
VLKKITIFIAVFFSTTVLAFAVNDVHVVVTTNFNVLTSDTAAAVTVTAATGGQVTNFAVQPNYIDITIDNLSAVTFNVAAASRYLVITRQSGSAAYAITPSCPGATATLTGTGAQTVLRLQVQTTNPCSSTPPVTPPRSGGGGGGGGSTLPATHPVAPPPAVPPATPPSQACARTGATDVPFRDITNHWAETYIYNLYRRCIVDGKTPNLFVPDDPATRAELVKIVLNTYNIGTIPFENLFTDVIENDWFAQYVTTAAKRDIVKGYVNPDGTSQFKPNQNITRAEALKVILKTKGITGLSGHEAHFDDVKKGDWYYDYVAYAQANNILTGYAETYGKAGRVRDLYGFPYLLSPGDANKQVQNLKEILRQLGYYSGPIDKTYDRQLTDAVTNYQIAKGMMPTGYMGEYTRTAILDETLVPVQITNFRPDAPITRAEISKIDVLVEKL